jgi:hypothetical protein
VVRAPGMLAVDRKVIIRHPLREQSGKECARRLRQGGADVASSPSTVREKSYRTHGWDRAGFN